MSMTPQAARILRYFRYAHLPAELQEISKPFAELAERVAMLPAADGAEQTVALRKLLEAKDCAVRSLLAQNGSASAPNPDHVDDRHS